MKRLLNLLLSLVLVLSLASNTCQHIHDETCGFNPETEVGCTHECDETCLDIDLHLDLGPNGGHD